MLAGRTQAPFWMGTYLELVLPGLRLRVGVEQINGESLE